MSHPSRKTHPRSPATKSSQFSQRQAASSPLFDSLYKKWGVERLVEELLSGKAVSLDESLSLLSLPLALLGKLASSITPQPRSNFRPILLLRIRESLAAYGKGKTVTDLSWSISETRKNIGAETLWLALDSWRADDSGQLAEALSTVEETLQRTTACEPLRILGPSTREIRALSSGAEKTDVSCILAMLTGASINNLAGGSDLEIHGDAARLRFSLSFAHDLSHMTEGSFSFDRAASRRALSPLENGERRFIFESVVTELLEARDRLGDQLTAWFPWVPHRFHGDDSSPFFLRPAMLFRVLAIARIMLGSSVRITAPVGMLGADLAQAALLFGANDLGFAAVDSATARALTLPRLNSFPSPPFEHHPHRREAVS